MAKITFLSSPNNYNNFVLNNIDPSVNGVIMLENCVIEDGFHANISLDKQLYISGNVIFDGGTVHCNDFIPELVNVNHIEVDNEAEITLEVHDSIKLITINSGVLNLSNYQNNNLYDINVGTEGIFVNNSNLPNTLRNIRQITMAIGAIFTFSTEDSDYMIESNQDNFVIDNIADKIKINEFIDDNFSNDIVNPSLKPEEFRLLSEYIKTPQKDILNDLLKSICGYDLTRVENYIDYNKFAYLGINTDQDSYFNRLPQELIGKIGKYVNYV